MIRRFPFHPFVLGLLPILFLFFHNRGQVAPSELVMPGAVVTLAVAVIFGMAWALRRDPYVAAVITSAAVVVVSWYGAAVTAIGGLVSATIPSRYWLALALVTFMVASVSIFRKPKAARQLTGPLNVFCLILLGIFGVRELLAGAAVAAPLSGAGPTSTEWDTATSAGMKPQRDIYYIILDGYARDDVLRDVYSFDNAEFTNALRTRGFHVNPHSLANYPLTFLSLASSLNGTHLTHLERSVSRSDDPRLAGEMISRNRIMAFLRGHGYTIVSFNSGWGPTRSIPSADLNIWCRATSEFVEMLLRQTAVWPVWARAGMADGYAGRLCQLDRLAAMRDMRGPKFVFAHLLIPHPPYVFTETGERVPGEVEALGGEAAWERKEPYIDQLRFVNRAMLSVVDSLTAGDGPEPIIILQSDHGTATARDGRWEAENASLVLERMPILNALFLPGFGDVGPEEFLTPVNTFPTIVNRYFGLNVPLSPNVSYFSSYESPYRFTPVDTFFRSELSARPAPALR